MAFTEGLNFAGLGFCFLIPGLVAGLLIGLGITRKNKNSKRKDR